MKIKREMGRKRRMRENGQWRLSERERKEKKRRCIREENGKTRLKKKMEAVETKT